MLVPKFKRLKKHGVIAAVVLAVLLATANFGSVKNQLNAWKLLPQPERYTELYFTDHQQLPTTYRPGQAQDVKFTVHNLEHQSVSYRYAIVASGGEGSAPPPDTLASGTFVLRHGEHKSISQPAASGDLGKRVKISVELKNQNHTIHYWLTKQD
jgi:hypothetical protein